MSEPTWVVPDHTGRIKELEQQLAEREKQIVMLRTAIDRQPYTMDKDVCEALAATDDLSGCILCDAEPVWYEITARDGTQCALTTQPVLLGHTSEPLYKAKELT